MKEHGYFIAKIQNDKMQVYLQKFNELIRGSKSINIKFIGDNPLSIKRERYTTAGKMCYCKDNEITGMQKQQNQWKPIECNSNCPYSQKDENGKSACNRIAWLKFLIPEISNSRIWLMKITGQESINNLDSYFTIQKLEGKKLNNVYTIFLTQKEQQNSKGQIFNNYILDIVEKENFVSNVTIQNQKEISTNSVQDVNNKVENKEQSPSTEVKETKKEAKKQKEESKNVTNVKSTTCDKKTKSKTKKTEIKQKEEQKTTNGENKENFDNCYVLLKTYNETILNKGQKKDYLIGEFSDMNDKISKIAIRPENANELLECDLGTLVKLDIQDIGERKFAIKLEFIEKRLKNIAA